MRPSKPTASAGTLRIPAPLSRRAVLLLVFALVGAWLLYAFLREWMLDQELHAQAARLRAQNAQIAAQNDAYRRELAAAGTPSAADETARSYGYAKPDEKVYVVSMPTPSPAAPSPAPVRPASTAPPHLGPVNALLSWLAALIRR